MKQLICLCGLLVAVAIGGAGCGAVGGTLMALSPPRKVPYPLSFHEEAHPSDNPELITKAKVPGTGLTLSINSFPVLSELDLVAARLKETPYGPSIELEFDDHGKYVLERLTLNRDRYIVVCVDGNPIMAWYVKKRITDGKFTLFGYFDEEHAKAYLAAWDKQIRKNLAP